MSSLRDFPLVVGKQVDPVFQQAADQEVRSDGLHRIGVEATPQFPLLQDRSGRSAPRPRPRCRPGSRSRRREFVGGCHRHCRRPPRRPSTWPRSRSGRGSTSRCRGRLLTSSTLQPPRCASPHAQCRVRPTTRAARRRRVRMPRVPRAEWNRLRGGALSPSFVCVCACVCARTRHCCIAVWTRCVSSLCPICAISELANAFARRSDWRSATDAARRRSSR